MHHIWSPQKVLAAVELGIDIFDSSYPFVVTERGGALNFKFDPKKHKNDNAEKGATEEPNKTTENIEENQNGGYEMNMKDKRLAND